MADAPEDCFYYFATHNCAPFPLVLIILRLRARNETKGSLLPRGCTHVYIIHPIRYVCLSPSPSFLGLLLVFEQLSSLFFFFVNFFPFSCIFIMIDTIVKFVPLYLAPILALTSTFLTLFAYLAPDLMLHSEVSLVTISPGRSILLPGDTKDSIDGPTVRMGMLGSCI